MKLSTTSKPDISNMSLDDIIKSEKPKRKISKKKGKAPTQPSDVDYEKFSDEQIRAELKKRGMPVKGSRVKLVARLKHCVRQAWEQYNKQMKKGTQTQAKKKTKLTAEQRQKITEENEANRLAKLKRKMENKKKAEAMHEELEAKRKAKKAEKAKRKLEHEKRMAEARERKRQKREATEAKRAKMEDEQKVQKEARQSCEAFAHFDIKLFSQQIQKKLDPKKQKITNISYDFSKKGFVIKFKEPKHVEMVTKGATMKKPTTTKFSLSTYVLPAPLESHCVFFLAPTALNHPNKAAADKWLSDQGASGLPELDKLQLWFDSALSTFATCGKIINVFRERGFMIVHFSDAACVTKFNQKYADKSFNGVPFVFLRTGTPTKRHRNLCDKEFPRPQKKGKK